MTLLKLCEICDLLRDTRLAFLYRECLFGKWSAVLDRRWHTDMWKPFDLVEPEDDSDSKDRGSVRVVCSPFPGLN